MLAQVRLHTSPLLSRRVSLSTAQSRFRHIDVKLPTTDAQRQTIYALSTPPGKGGIGVVRVSGPRAGDVWASVLKLKSSQITPAKLERCRVVHPGTKETIDDGMAVFFKGPKSFTTEDVVELHIHSGRAVVSSVLSALSSLNFCRPAQPGEFTRRAFKGGRMDLTQVEGLRDLIDAETDMQRKLALASVEGKAGNEFEKLRKEVIHALAMVEALIDFGEGEDIETGVFDSARGKVKSLYDTIQEYLNDSRRGEIMRSGIRLAIFGPPNAGKSSLLNFLAQRDAAIVTPIPGTTRDILELSLDIAGLPIIVADTAGLRHTEDYVESIGIERATKAIQGADVALCVLSLPDAYRDGKITLPKALEGVVNEQTLFLFNKSDLIDTSIPSGILSPYSNAKHFWTASLQTSAGLPEFLAGLAETIKTRFEVHELHNAQGARELPLITNARHRKHFQDALIFLEAFLQYGPDDVVLGAEELRYAAQALGKICGTIDTEDVLDAIFREFCIGK